MTDAPRLATDRLLLVALDADALDALILRDRARLEGLTGARFPEPLAAPPLMEDALPSMRDNLRSNPDDTGWWPWSIVVAATGEAAGMLGLAGPPDAEGNTLLGYTLYPARGGRGYATEAARALLGWAFAQPGVRAVRATIPVGHTPSLRVARRLGLHQVGTSHDNEQGLPGIFEVRRGSAAPPRRGA